MKIKSRKFKYGLAKTSGFSILELLIVTSLISILLLIGSANFKNFFQEEELARSTTAWMNTIRAARYLAIKTHEAVTLHWQPQIYIEQKNQTPWRISSISSQINIQFHAGFFRDNKLTFLPDGFSQGQQGHFDLCLKSTNACQKIIILSSGVVRLEQR